MVYNDWKLKFVRNIEKEERKIKEGIITYKKTL
jgi:hypothetical protein